jgi:[ribosomal protein S5]-alanine N-acetyltransferase
VTGDAAPAGETSALSLPILRTPRVVIRPLTDGDREACRTVLAPLDEDALVRWFTWAVAAPAALADLHQPPFGERGIVLADCDELIGLTGLVPSLGPFAQLEGAPAGGPWSAEFGLYWALSPEHRGRGYATEAVTALCQALFTTLHAKRLIAMTEHANVASQAVMRRVGMTLLANPHAEPAWLQVVGVLDAAPPARFRRTATCDDPARILPETSRAPTSLS